LRPSPSGTGSGMRAIARATSDGDAGNAAPDWIACRTVKRVLRRVAERALPTRTSRTGQLATRRCHGLAAVVGGSSIVSALSAASRGARSAPTVKPTTTAIRPSAADSSANTAVTWRGVKPTAQQADLAVLRGGARTDEDRYDREDDDEQHDRVGREDDRGWLCFDQRVRALVFPGGDEGGSGRQGRRGMRGESGRAGKRSSASCSRSVPPRQATLVIAFGTGSSVIVGRPSRREVRRGVVPAALSRRRRAHRED
jgi:hypothetical protein